VNDKTQGNHPETAAELPHEVVPMTGGSSEVARLEARLGVRWANLSEARLRTEDHLAKLAEEFASFGTEDLSVVLFGSMARGEVTEGSDLDWALLVDGRVDPHHFDHVAEIAAKVEKVGLRKPGREGTFGSPTYSHDLVHHIGGADDTNHNTTQRSLLLLESKAVGRVEAYERVVPAILNRYLLEDRTFALRTTDRHVPRFLLNDFARYWRTMAVDFAYKRRDRRGDGAALRNLKLRMSRKLLYASGLLVCFACELKLARSSVEPACEANVAECVDCLRALLRITPLDRLALVVLGLLDHAEQRQATDSVRNAARMMFTAYDGFIGILADKAQREELENVEQVSLDDSASYRHGRKLSHDFRDGLLALFFDADDRLADLTRRYGVF
jgi:predicted nucleotidyltransferase